MGPPPPQDGSGGAVGGGGAGVAGGGDVPDADDHGHQRGRGHDDCGGRGGL